MNTAHLIRALLLAMMIALPSQAQFKLGATGGGPALEKAKEDAEKAEKERLEKEAEKAKLDAEKAAAEKAAAEKAAAEKAAAEKAAAEKPATPDKPATNPSATKPTTRKAFVLPEFPPGIFSDGGIYRLNELHGKTIVLFFFDGADDRAYATMAQRSALVEKFRGRPVAFFGIQADSIYTVRNSSNHSGLAMPVFSDILGVMSVRYQVALSAAKTWDGVIIDGEGKISHEDLTEAAIEKTLPKAEWKYRGVNYDAKVLPSVDAFESGQYELGGKTLANLLTGKDKKALESGRQFQNVLIAEAQHWKADADKLLLIDPITAYELYARISAVLPGSDIAKSVADSVKRLEAVRRVKDELAARNMYEVLCAAISRDDQIKKSDAAAYCDQIVRSYPATPTAERLVKYLDDLGKAKERVMPKGRKK